jgi:hypothetical protein
MVVGDLMDIAQSLDDLIAQELSEIFAPESVPRILPPRIGAQNTSVA